MTSMIHDISLLPDQATRLFQITSPVFISSAPVTSPYSLFIWSHS